MLIRRWRSRVAAVSAAAVALTAALTAPGQPALAAPAGGDPAPTAATDRPSGFHDTVTLVTGDTVEYSETAQGPPRVVIEPDARSDRGALTYLSIPDGDSYYVYPSDALPLIQSGRLDRGLFDVEYLATHGYGQMESLPVIAQYGPTVSANATTLESQAEALPANGEVTPLPSVHGAGFDVPKDQTDEFWSALVGEPTARTLAAPATLSAGLSKLWLDRVVIPTLDRSTRQIHAPAAWDVGLDGTGVRVAVLDSGIDLDHPDFAGRIERAVNFTDDESVHDGFGHGTHVASILAGSGAASDGKYRGVAPGATLLVGKVIRDFGTGPSRAMLEGMEWAAEQGADVVNMSMGVGAGDGTDLYSMAVNNLTEQYGTLFVIAAGNAGPNAQTVGSPGTADAALTVGAVDRDDTIAPFSSRGPRLNNYGLKPDITAPGVGIVAARSNPSIVGGAAGDLYMSLNGTSMATPHVAGAAAILAQEHPDWTADQLKPVLVSSAEDTGNRTYEQGTGRVDVARAIDQEVYSTGNVDFGKLAYPRTGPAQRTLTYANNSDEAVTLDLTATLSNGDDPAPDGMLSLDQPTVTVPANGTAEVTLALDPTVANEATWYGGAISATADGVEVRTAVGGYLEPRSYEVTATVIPPDGVTELGIGSVLFSRVDGRQDRERPVIGDAGQTETTVRLYGGPHAAAVSVGWFDSTGRNTALAIEPEFQVDADHTTVTLDLRELREVTVDAPGDTETYLESVAVSRADADQYGGLRGSLTASPAVGRKGWITPTSAVTLGKMSLTSQFQVGAPEIRMRVPGHHGVRLHPRYQGSDTTNLPKLDGRRTLSLVSGGTGTAEDLAGVDADGKLVLLDLSDVCPRVQCGQDVATRVANAANAGAAAVLLFGRVGHVLFGFRTGPIYAVPTMSLPASEALDLLNRLEHGHGRVRVHTVGVPRSPYLYSLAFPENGSIPDDVSYEVDRRDLYRVDDRFHAGTSTTEQMSWSGQHDNALIAMIQKNAERPAPNTLTEYLGPVSDEMLWTRSVEIQYRDTPSGLVSNFGAYEYFDRPGRRTESWGEQPFVTAPASYSDRILDSPWMASVGCENCRAGDTLVPLTKKLDQAGHTTAVDDNEFELVRDGQSIPVKRRGIVIRVWFFNLYIPVDTFDVPADPGTYQLSQDATTTFAMRRYSRHSDTTYSFQSRSATPETANHERCVGQALLNEAVPCVADEVLRLRYGIDLDQSNRALAGLPQRITLSGYYGNELDDPRLRDASLEVSFDDGAHWRDVWLFRHHGDFTGWIWSPPLDRTTGAVSIRAHAVDTHGNEIEQTIDRAFGLRGFSPRDGQVGIE